MYCGVKNKVQLRFWHSKHTITVKAGEYVFIDFLLIDSVQLWSLPRGFITEMIFIRLSFIVKTPKLCIYYNIGLSSKN